MKGINKNNLSSLGFGSCFGPENQEPADKDTPFFGRWVDVALPSVFRLPPSSATIYNIRKLSEVRKQHCLIHPKVQ